MGRASAAEMEEEELVDEAARHVEGAEAGRVCEEEGELEKTVEEEGQYVFSSDSGCLMEESTAAGREQR